MKVRFIWYQRWQHRIDQTKTRFALGRPQALIEAGPHGFRMSWVWGKFPRGSPVCPIFREYPDFFKKLSVDMPRATPSKCVRILYETYGEQTTDFYWATFNGNIFLLTWLGHHNVRDREIVGIYDYWRSTMEGNCFIAIYIYVYVYVYVYVHVHVHVYHFTYTYVDTWDYIYIYKIFSLSLYIYR